MARPLAPMRRLLRLRDRAEQGEKMSLRQVEQALRREEEAYQSFSGTGAGDVTDAAALSLCQGVRDASWQRAQQLERDVAVQMQHWQQAKREHRQAELLFAERKQEHDKELMRKELRQQEDWARARAARMEEEP